MRLINVDTLHIHTFTEQDTPPYAILSHTWGHDELTFQEMCLIVRMRSLARPISSQVTDQAQNGNTDGSAHSHAVFATMEALIRSKWSTTMDFPSIDEDVLNLRGGYRKVTCSAREAKQLGFQWLWVDTCCIDKTSSAELQESINSMYKWYRESAICLVYLEDVTPGSEPVEDTQVTYEATDNVFTNCRWITRGWTLQELVAPLSLRFYYQDWTLMGDKREFIEELTEATGIHSFVLDNGDLNEVSLAQRMSWASYRRTTRVEDMAYCLLGIFDIQMPLLYGEGEKAFVRLQEEILKTTDDYSLFAWQAVGSDSQNSARSVYRGLLARSPLEFRECRSVERENTTCVFPISATAIGLHVELEFLIDPKDKTRFLAFIRCNNSMNQRLAIYLRCLDGGNQYARVEAGTLISIDNWPTGQLRPIYVRQKLSIPTGFCALEMRCFHIRRRVSNQFLPPPVKVTTAFPLSQWNSHTQELTIPSTTMEFLGVLFLRAQSSPYGSSTEFQVIVGFSRRHKHYWCKALQRVWPAMNVEPARWRAAIKKALPLEIEDPLLKNDVRHDIFVVRESGMGINVEVRAGMCGDHIALPVLIDGFVKGS